MVIISFILFISFISSFTLFPSFFLTRYTDVPITSFSPSDAQMYLSFSFWPGAQTPPPLPLPHPVRRYRLVPWVWFRCRLCRRRRGCSLRQISVPSSCCKSRFRMVAVVCLPDNKIPRGTRHQNRRPRIFSVDQIMKIRIIAALNSRFVFWFCGSDTSSYPTHQSFPHP